MRESDKTLAIIGWGALAFAIGAFAIKAIDQPSRLDRYTPLVVVHALAMASWFALFAFQAQLMSAGAARFHRQIGKISPVVAGLVLVSGGIVTLQFGQEFHRADSFAGDVASLLVFASLYGLAIHAARQKNFERHRRAMLVGTLFMLGPAIARFLDVIDLSRMWTILGMLISYAGIPIAYDLATGGVRRSTVLIVLFATAVFFAAAIVALVPSLNQAVSVALLGGA